MLDFHFLADFGNFTLIASPEASSFAAHKPQSSLASSLCHQPPCLIYPAASIQFILILQLPSSRSRSFFLFQLPYPTSYLPQSVHHQALLLRPLQKEKIIISFTLPPRDFLINFVFSFSAYLRSSCLQFNSQQLTKKNRPYSAHIFIDHGSPVHRTRGFPLPSPPIHNNPRPHQFTKSKQAVSNPSPSPRGHHPSTIQKSP